MDNDKKLTAQQEEIISEKVSQAEDFADDDPSVEWARFAAQACALRQKLNEKKNK